MSELDFKRLFIDIETSPNKVLAWRTGWKINLSTDNIIEERQIICASWKWEGQKTVHSSKWLPMAVPKSFKIGKKSYKGYDLAFNDLPVLEGIIPVMDTADEIVYQNGDKFDLPWLRARALFHRYPMMPFYPTFDTLQKTKRAFYLNSNRLDYVQKFIGGKGKIHTNYQLWRDVVLDNNEKQLAYMVKYCNADVEELEEYFNEIYPYVGNKTHVGVNKGFAKWTCKYCGTHDVRRRKKYITAAGTLQHYMTCAKGHHYKISDTEYRKYIKEIHSGNNNTTSRAGKKKKQRS